MQDKKTIGRHIRALRQMREFGVEQLAAKAGISPSHLSRLERGLAEPSFMVVANLANALDVTVADLMERAGIPGPPREGS